MSNLLFLKEEWAWVVRSLCSPVLLYLLPAIIALLISYNRNNSSSKPDIEKLPSINPVGMLTSNSATKRLFLTSSITLFKKARQLFPNQPYRMLTDLGDVVVLPHGLVDEIRNQSKLSFPAANLEDFHGKVPGFEAMSQFANDDQLLEAVVRKQLTRHLANVIQPLSEETSNALLVNFGDSPDWQETALKPALLDIVSRISSRVFLGTQLCRDEDWLRITKQYTINLFTGATKLRVYPKSLRRFVHWFVPECKVLRAQFQAAQRLLKPVMEARQAERRAVLEAGGDALYANDALDWADEEALKKGIEYDAAAFQLMLSVSAIHTTTDLLMQVMLDLAEHPECMQAGRNEVTQELKANGWSKTSLHNMKLIDSLIKESQRLKPVSLAAMRRLAVEDIKLSTGLVIPKGTRTFVDAYRMRDPEVHKNPEQWDGSRFLRMRLEPNREHMSQLVATHPDHLAFGHGVYACPGRFFAAIEIKILVCHMLLKYDWKLARGTDVSPLVLGAATMANPGARLLIRHRENIGLDVDSC